MASLPLPEGLQELDELEKYKLHEEVWDSPKRKRESPLVKLASPSAGSSSNRPKLEDLVQASYEVIFQLKLAQPSPASIQLVKDYIESRRFMKALEHIVAIESKFPSSALIQGLKALVFATIGGVNGLVSLLSKVKGKDKHTFFDNSTLPDVAATFEAVWLHLGDLDEATRYIYELTLVEGHNHVGSLRKLFNCYSRNSLFAEQLEVSLKMYKLVREDKFLFWAVFCIQLQVPFLVCMSITEQQELHDPVREILCKLGPTLLVVKPDKRYPKGGRLLAHVCDYAAAVKVLRKKIESCDPVDWECLLSDLDSLPENYSGWCGEAVDNKIHPLTYLACKISQLPNETQCGSKILEALKSSNLENGKSRCLLDGKDNDVFEEAVYEFFTRVDLTTQKPFQILSKDEEYWLLENLLKPDILTTDLLKEKFSKLCTFSRIPKHFGAFYVGDKSAVHGTGIVIKTSKFIILAGDGELTSAYSDKALFSRSDKIRQFDDLCIGVTGVWKSLSKTISVSRKCMRRLKKNGKGRPTVKKFAKHIAKKSRILNEAFEVIICAFDEVEVGQSPVASVSCAGNFRHWDVKESFYCSGRCSEYAEHILSEGKVGEDMGLAEAICWVERALVFVAMFDSCTGGLANITVIDSSKNVRVMAREYIHTTLWEKHRHFFENRKA
ncbi:hypothetical protein C5167_007979 [Papaver somniferum]|uniref:Uncharacterized protein n=1 Tax=Papaver somniferum TaxID=3469 RepID=A0A4Y7JT69_PAPSO|nr:hypothetical protein C5167_007979 [Papaver somniferum]